jgi:hypothetical protein
MNNEMDEVMDDANNPSEVEPNNKRPAPLTQKERSRNFLRDHPATRKEDPKQSRERSRRNRQKKLERDAAMEQQLADALSQLDLHKRECAAKDAAIDHLEREGAAKDKLLATMEQKLSHALSRVDVLERVAKALEKELTETREANSIGVQRRLDHVTTDQDADMVRKAG